MSLDDVARELFGVAASSIADIGKIPWINPVTDSESVAHIVRGNEGSIRKYTLSAVG
jgi:hypothetical protein